MKTKIESIHQFDRKNKLRSGGFSFFNLSDPYPRYFMPSDKKNSQAIGWTRETWKSMISNFKLEFIYDEN